MGINVNIIRTIANLSSNIDQNGDRWTNQLNLISWNNGRPVFDVREWNENHSKCRVGVKLDADEVMNLVQGFTQYAKEVELI